MRCPTFPCSWPRLGCLVVAAIGLATASPAYAAFCTGKQNGLWCDGNALVNCQGGNAKSTANCPAGCQSNPPGVADACKAASGPCAGKQDGAWCSGNDLLNCQGGNVASKQACPAGCQSNPVGVADVCKSGGACAGKQDGAWCDGNDLLKCQGGTVASKQACPAGCQSNPVGVADVCKAAAPSGPCAGKPDGAWCDGDTLRQCKGGAVASSQGCPNGCQSMPDGVADQCKPAAPTGFCAGKADGKACDGSALVTCGGGKTIESTACAKGCAGLGPGKAACQVKTAGFCTGKQDGGWCDGPLLATCKGGTLVAAFACPKGCQPMPDGVADVCKAADPPKPATPGTPAGSVGAASDGGCGSFSGSVDLWAGSGKSARNQKDHGDQLGTCPGLTIHSDGCTITALSMLHDYLGLTRTVGSETGSGVVLENKWRTATSGAYGGTSYSIGGVPKSGNCLVVWAKTAGGLVPSHSHNASDKCLSPGAVQFIASSLNAGMPVVAGVHWASGGPAGQAEDWHWVLIVGADANGVLINDPWGGKERIRLSQGGLGSYVVDDLYSFFWPGQGGNQSPLDDTGDPIADDALPSTNGYVPDDQKDAPAADAGSVRDTGSLRPDTAAETTAVGNVYVPPPSASCSVGRGSGLPVAAAAMLLLAARAVLRRRRR